MLAALTMYHQHYFSTDLSSFLKWGIGFTLLLSVVGSIMVLGDLLRMSFRWVPSHRELIADLEKRNPTVQAVIEGRVMQIKEKQRKKNELTEDVEEVLAVVYGETRYAPVLGALGVAWRALLLLFLFTLLSINLSCAFRAPLYSNLDPDSSFISYLYNVFIGMFLLGFENTPMNDLARVVAIVEIMTGISILLVALDLVVSDIYADIYSYRDAIREHLIVMSRRAARR